MFLPDHARPSVIVSSRRRTTVFERVRTRLATAPLSRLRRALLMLYLFVAAADATGKALATNTRVNALAQELVGGRARTQLDHAARPAGNFEIFRAASRH